MTTTVALDFHQIKSRVAAIRAKDPNARFIGLRAEEPWKGGERCRDGEELYRVVRCDAPIQFRVAFQEPRGDETAVVLITSLEDNQLEEDIRVRLARRRLHGMDRWRMVKSIFQARGIDPRVTAHGWIAERLSRIAPAKGYAPAPSGVLDAETAWEILLTRELNMPGGAPDLIALVQWTANRDHAARWQAADKPFRDAAAAWIRQSAGRTSRAILRCTSKNREPLALPVGIALGVIHHPSAGGALDKAAGRIEQLTGNAEIEPEAAQRWSAAALEVARRGFPREKERRLWLERADDLLESVGAGSHAHLSDVSPAGFEQRLARFGRALEHVAARPGTAGAAELLDARDRVLAHDMARGGGARRMERVTMAVRLLRWLRGVDSRRPPASLSEAAAGFAAEGGFVDWARRAIMGGEAEPTLSRAYKKLFAAVTRVRERQNQDFSRLLRVWTRAGSRDGSARCIERVVEEVIAPVARLRPVLLLLIDGMSHDVFRELMADLTEREWAELGGEDGAPLPPVIAAIPSWTRLSRTSLFCGAIREGGSHEERKGFAAHSALPPARGAKKAPVLFHKIALTDAEDGALSEELRETIASRSHRVAAAVINAVDDHLLKGDQTNPQWTADYIRALPALLYEARAAGRVVAILSDHGCVLENGTTQTKKGEGERWRTASGRVEKGEIRISGSRVRAEGARELIAPWSEAIRYGAKKNGYHGGVSLQEMVAPMALLTSGDDRLDGWSELPARTPPWWEEPGRRAPVKSGPRDKQMTLFSRESVPSEAPRASRDAMRTSRWVDRLLSSDVYQAQKSSAGRPPSDELVRKLASALAAHGGPMPLSALSREMAVPESRLPGLIDSTLPVLNVEGYAILTSEEASRTAELDVAMLKRHFEIE